MSDTTHTDCWVCYHPDLGYLKFGSYKKVTRSPQPSPRGLFTKRRDAERRQKQYFSFAGSRYPGKEIQVRKLRLTFEVVPE